MPDPDPSPHPAVDEPPAPSRHVAHLREISWRGWLSVMARVGKEIRDDNLDIVAAGMTFYALLALGPAFVALLSIYGLFASPADVATLLEPLFSIVPAGGGRQLIEDLLHRAVNTAPTSLTLRALGAFGLSLWSANQCMKTLIAAVSLAYDESGQRGFVRANLLSVGFVIVGTMVLLLTAVALIALPHLLAGSKLGDGIGSALTLARWPALFAVVVIGLSSLYRWGPTRRAPRWRLVALGAVFATLCWLLFSAMFSVYSHNVGKVRTGLEGLDNVIGLLLWLYASAFAILLGAELNAAIERQIALDDLDDPLAPSPPSVVSAGS